jgi:hypothetical protein
MSKIVCPVNNLPVYVPQKNYFSPVLKLQTYGTVQYSIAQNNKIINNNTNALFYFDTFLLNKQNNRKSHEIIFFQIPLLFFHDIEKHGQPFTF